MIAIIDFACKGESHDIFNAGTIYQISRAFTDEEIVFLADKTHLDCVASIIPSEEKQRIRFTNANINEKKYSDFFLKNVDSLPISKVIITSIYIEDLNYIYKVMSERTSIQFIMLQHGQIEYLVDKNAFKQRFHVFRFYPHNIRMHISLLHRYIGHKRKCIKERKEKGHGKNFSVNMELCSELENVKFVVFSDNYKKYTKKISSKIISKFEKVDLPYVFDFDLEKKQENLDIIKIGLMPTIIDAPDELALRVILWFNMWSGQTKKKVEFVFFRHDSWDLKNVCSFENKDYDRKNMNDFLRICDFILLPIGSKKYKLSTSGTLLDAINAETPIIMGPSNSFNEFEDKRIGFRGNNVIGLGKIIIKIANELRPDDYANMVRNLKMLKKEMEEKNIERWVSILNGK